MRLGRHCQFRRNEDPQELHCFSHDAKLAAFLPALFIVPLVKAQPAFDEKRAAFSHVLGNVFRRATKHIHVHKSHFFLFLASFAGPDFD